jgi:hypothetical protein
MALYKSLSGEQLDLSILTSKQKKLVKECFEDYSANMQFRYFVAKIYSAENMKIAGHKFERGRYWVTPQSGNTVIYKVLKDMEAALGMAQGIMIDDGSKLDEGVLRKL